MAEENQMPVDVPENLYTWIVAEAERKKVTVEYLVANALSHYRAAVKPVNALPQASR